MTAEIIKDIIKAFNPNTDASGEMVKGSPILPSFSSMGGFDTDSILDFTGIESYIRKAEEANGGIGSILDQVIKASDSVLAKDLREIAKGIDIPANMLSYARMSYMPDATNSGILSWPGVHPEALRKIVRENIAPNLIISTRVDDVLRYSNISTHPWKPGWRIEVFQGTKSPTTQEKKDIREAEEFLWNSSDRFSYQTALERDYENLTNFQVFLAAGTRDTLTFDGLAINTQRDAKGRVKEYGLLPAGNIRLVGPKGYLADPEAYAVAVDEGGSVVKAYTRTELIWAIRNPRIDPEYSISLTRGYGYPEIEQSLKLIQGFSNVIEYNSDVFNRSGVPHGILLLTGNGWLQKQVDVLMRMWRNLKAGISKALALPVLAAPANGKVEVVDFSRIKGDEALYQDMMNLCIGCFCAMYRFPPARLGYRISGKKNPPKQDPMSSSALNEHDDVGLIALLTFWERVINENLIWPRWSGLKFRFTGAQPKEDAREYELRKNALTWKEARAEADLPPLTAGVSSETKELAELMEMCPLDPNMSGVFQSIVAAYVKGKADAENEEMPGNTMTSKKDPARAEANHGHTSGVRRDSAAETRSANSKV